MVEIHTTIYKEGEKGKLHFFGKIMCVAYEPTIEVKSNQRRNSDLSVFQPHITFKMGEFRLHFNKEDMKKLLEELDQ